MKIYIQDVDEFVSSSKQISRNLALHHLLTNGSSAVNGCRQKRVQTSDENNTIIHNMTPVHQLTSCEAKRCVFIINKSIIKTFLSSSESTIHYIAFSSTKVILSESGETYAQIKHCLQVNMV